MVAVVTLPPAGVCEPQLPVKRSSGLVAFRHFKEQITDAVFRELVQQFRHQGLADTTPPCHGCYEKSYDFRLVTGEPRNNKSTDSVVIRCPSRKRDTGWSLQKTEHCPAVPAGLE